MRLVRCGFAARCCFFEWLHGAALVQPHAVALLKNLVNASADSRVARTGLAGSPWP